MNKLILFFLNLLLLNSFALAKNSAKFFHPQLKLKKSFTKGKATTKKIFNSQSQACSSSPYYYYQNGRRLNLCLNNQKIMKFTSNGQRYENVTDANIEIKQSQNLLRSKTRQSSYLSYQKQLELNSISPVFTNNDCYALPGNIFVYFQPDWSTAKIEAWIINFNQQLINEGKGQWVKIKERKKFGKNLYLLETPIGLPSLEISNKIYESGDVVSASPNCMIKLKKF